MIVYTVTLNPALDLFLSPPVFLPGKDNRYAGQTFLPGGKGVNVSLLLHSLGIDTAALGLAAGFTGHALVALLEAQGCRADFHFLDQGFTRINVKITPPGQHETALNGGGPAVTPQDLDRLGEKFAGLRAGDYLVLAGSAPSSLPADVYARLMKQAPAGVRVAADTSGPALRAAVEAGPFLVKPNLEELAEFFGLDRVDEAQAVDLARELQGLGAENVLVSMGGRGALLVDGDGGVTRRAALAGREVSAVGAGDSMVAGFIYGLEKEGNYAGALEWGMAAGAATAFREGIATAGQVRALKERQESLSKDP